MASAGASHSPILLDALREPGTSSGSILTRHCRTQQASCLLPGKRALGGVGSGGVQIMAGPCIDCVTLGVPLNFSEHHADLE